MARRGTNTGSGRIGMKAIIRTRRCRAHAWQSARSLGAWTLLGCTVAPGFDFSGFELAPEGFQP
jgi:predicted cupin superfamily sugar epimerase